MTEDDTGLRVLYPLGDNGCGNLSDVTIEYDFAMLRVSAQKLTWTGSIVAIHGIGAHPDDTWNKNIGTKETPCYVNWLSDSKMLPAVVPLARIMRYGYESAWFGRDTIQQSVSEVAVRLLRSIGRVRKVWKAKT